MKVTLAYACFMAIVTMSVCAQVQAQTANVTLVKATGQLGSVKLLTGTLTKPLKDKSGAKTLAEAGKVVELADVSDGVVESALVSGKVPTGGTFDAATGLATISNVSGVSLTKAKVVDVKFKAATLKETGNVLDVGTDGLSLTDASASGVTLKTMTLAPADFKQADLKPGANEANQLPLAGDYFKFLVRVHGFRRSDAPDGEPVTAARDACFRVSQDIEPKDGNGPRIARGTFVTKNSSTFGEFMLPPYSCEDPGDGIKDDQSYDVATATLVSDRDRLRYGWTYGLLVAPFKFYRKEREFSAGATVGPYLGYRIRDRPGSTQTFAVAVGPTAASVTTESNGTTDTHMTTGLTVAVAYIGTIKGTFNYALVVGRDYFSKSEAVDPVRRHTWLGLAFGFDLK